MAPKLDAYYVFQNFSGGVSFATPRGGHVWADLPDNPDRSYERIARTMAGRHPKFPLRNEAPPGYQKEGRKDGRPLSPGQMGMLYHHITARDFNFSARKR